MHDVNTKKGQATAKFQGAPARRAGQWGTNLFVLMRDSALIVATIVLLGSPANAATILFSNLVQPGN